MRRPTKRSPPAKRKRVKRKPDPHIDRGVAARLNRIAFAHGYIGEVWLTHNRWQMNAVAKRINTQSPGHDAMAAVHGWHSRIDLKTQVTHRRKVFRMVFNRKDLERIPGDIVAHESTHAALVWLRVRKSFPWDDEEDIADAVGGIAQRVANILYPQRCWP